MRRFIAQPRRPVTPNRGNIQWQNMSNLESIEFTCGHCAKIVASTSGYFPAGNVAQMRVCPHCTLPTLFSFGSQMPGVTPGSNVENVPDEVNGRRATENSLSGFKKHSRQPHMTKQPTNGAWSGRRAHTPCPTRASKHSFARMVSPSPTLINADAIARAKAS